ncbi:MAG TPA: endolytic transglycosylase MltG [Terriglobia bacterium]|nr:endolytic transglycosylase MltG [Terriglobia bacterium]
MKKLLPIAFALAVLGGVLLAVEALQPYQGYPEKVIVTIPPGSGAEAAARALASQRVLRYRAPFLALYALGRPKHRTLKAGEYLFNRPLSPRDVYWKIVRGDIYYLQVVIPEGSDRFDMARLLQERLGLDPRAFLRATLQTALIRDLDPAAPTLEGYLFPDTYRFPAGVTAAAVVENMLARFREVFRSRLQAELNGRSLHDVVTLASLVEKETPNAAERREIAGVFLRRVERGMALDCDPTVAYAARLDSQGGANPLPRRPSITLAVLDSPSPYNTYRTPGLPPGPICSPGAASMEAALHPASSDALYFVSNLHGGHVFAKTLDEHNRNVARYRRQIAARDTIQTVKDPAPAAHRRRRHARTRSRH